MSNKRKKYSPELKAKVALAALKNDETIADLAQRFGVNPTMIAAWKRSLLAGAADIFDKSQKTRKQVDRKIDEPLRQIGQLMVAIGAAENGFRQVLGVVESAKEEKTGWSKFLRRLKQRGLTGVNLIISDARLVCWSLSAIFILMPNGNAASFVFF